MYSCVILHTSRHSGITATILITLPLLKHPMIIHRLSPQEGHLQRQEGKNAFSKPKGKQLFLSCFLRYHFFLFLFLIHPCCNSSWSQTQCRHSIPRFYKSAIHIAITVSNHITQLRKTIIREQALHPTLIDCNRTYSKEITKTIPQMEISSSSGRAIFLAILSNAESHSESNSRATTKGFCFSAFFMRELFLLKALACFHRPSSISTLQTNSLFFHSGSSTQGSFA